ncbi:MAG: GTPase HflX [Clostridiales bacterium]|nr:GTPase HflX [Clostridiales bacterium]
METQENIEIRAILVGLNTKDRFQNTTLEESMEELSELAEAAGVEVIAMVLQNRFSVHPAYFIGRGKVEEIAELCEVQEINLVIFNDELSGAQIRNLEEILKVSVIDRTTLILDIFARRARTKEGKLQVELAQLTYRLPRLVGLGKELSRQAGGIGTRGPGEMQLETDRRHILRRIDDIKKQLIEVRKNREIQRSQRLRSDLPIVALVGYTNAGKSTLMNALLSLSEDYDEKLEVYTENKLFATLDTSLRKIVLSNNFTFLLTDTVGFVSDLPHNLIDAFKSTLEEVKYADLLLHVIDSSNRKYDLQMDTTLKVLQELEIDNKKTINVFNKCDLIEDTSMISKDEYSVFISAKKMMNIDKLLDKIQKNIGREIINITLNIPYKDGYIVSEAHEDGNVKTLEYDEEGIIINMEIDKNYYSKYKKFESE